LVVCLIGFVAFFAASQGAVIWVLFSEMFPNNIRSRGVAIGTFSHWFFNGLTAFLFPIIVGLFSDGKGTGYVFAFYAVATLIGYFFYKKYLIETKGKSLEQIEKELFKTEDK
jgi:MFS family permease